VEALSAGEELGAGEGQPLFLSTPPPPSWHRQKMRSGRFELSFFLPLSAFICDFPWCAHTFFLGRRAKGSLQLVAERGLFFFFFFFFIN